MDPNRVIVDLPAEYRAQKSVIDVCHEEEAICWLWAFPSLWPWDKRITWLYTPVVGSAIWPGDLWGIDSNGDLLIIEAKRCKGQNDAFIRFVQYHNNERDELSASHWKKKWRFHLEAELAFPDSTSERRKGHTNGMLPRSNKRKHIRKWRILAKDIRQQIESTVYERDVERNLQRRESMGNPAPYYFGLMIEMESQSRILSPASIRSGNELRRRLAPEHVLAVSIGCRPDSDKKGLISTKNITL
jgi:hypothetical protein